ncbi:MAG: serine/threonine-protein kinase, partial [Planctomycetota bacterium]
MTTPRDPARREAAASYRRAFEVFSKALTLSGAERETFLDEACAGDAILREEVLSLLAHDAPASSEDATAHAAREALLGMADSPGGSSASGSACPREGTDDEAAGEVAGERPSDVIDRYKLLQLIGEGGMGTVWMAEQFEPVKRRVALKVVKLGMDTREVLRRFEAERQALALMDHPNIAKVLDGGATASGRPYFVMELLKGTPITEYCDQARLDVRGRLSLFTQVCEAIQHAHHKGVIHRDVKPSNVLVTLQDGVPVPKVIDFGIAKATSAELTAKTLFTRFEQVVGTPEYMAPEQAERSGLDIDTRSDVYSLGVLLYELLTGTTPFSLRETMQRGYDEMLRTIREDDPERPSTRVSTLGETATRIAQSRHADTHGLSRSLRGDLDWIVMKALEKDRTRRYETANGLAADVRRHLDDEPVSAGAPSRAYRLRKFVRRNRGKVVAGGAVAAALLFGILAFAGQAAEARHQRDLAVAAKDAEAEQRRLAEAARADAESQAVRAKEQEAEATKQAALAEAIATFQTDMLAAAAPHRLLGEQVTVFQVMTAAIEELDRGSLADQPLVEAGVRDTIGNTLQSLARYDEAEPNLRKALEIRRAALPAGHPSIAQSLNSLALLLNARNNLAEAESLYREALEINRAARPAGHPDISRSLHNLANPLKASHRIAEAEPLLREALEINRAAFPDSHPVVAISLTSLALLLHARGSLIEAEPLLREALEINLAAYPAGHPEVAHSLT